MKISFCFLFAFLSIQAFSQSAQELVAQNKTKSTQYVANEFVGLYAEKLNRYDQQQTAGKTADLKNIYESFGTYPDSIVTGWHEVVVMDNSKIFKAAKVYMRSNSIQRFVIDNCIDLSFTAEKPVRGKAVVTLTKPSGDPLQLVDVYFMDDLEKPTTFEEPSEPGYVCFWTRSKRSAGREIIIDKKRIDAIPKALSNQPDCFDEGTSTIALKPGMYKVEILKSGNNIDVVLKVQAGICTFYELD